MSRRALLQKLDRFVCRLFGHRWIPPSMTNSDEYLCLDCGTSVPRKQPAGE